MSETTYLPQVECVVETEDGLFGTSVVYVTDETGRNQYLRVGKGDVLRHDGKTYLDVGLVRLDHAGRRVLVELPSEADSGTRRLWVPLTRFPTKQEQAE
jgi:hypothetical protein